MRFLFLLALVLCAPAGAQSLLRNGDFATGSLAPWTLSGQAKDPKIERAPVTGTGQPNNAFALTMEPGKIAVLRQSFTRSAPVTYGEVSWDVYWQASRVDHVSVTAKVFLVYGSIRGDAIGEAHVFYPVLPTGRARFARIPNRMLQQGTTTVEIEFHHQSGTLPVRLFVDNIDVRPYRPPMVDYPFPFAGQTQAIGIAAHPGVPFALFLSPGLLPTPLRIPGFDGALELDPRTTVFVVAGRTPAVGYALVRLTIPPDPRIRGIPLYWQALAMHAVTNRWSLGWSRERGIW